MNDPKLCPFCGGQASDKKFPPNDGNKYVTCRNESCAMHDVGMLRDAWDTRAAPEDYVTREEMHAECERAVTAAARTWSGNLIDPGDYALIPVMPDPKVIHALKTAGNLGEAWSVEGFYKALVAIVQEQQP